MKKFSTLFILLALIISCRKDAKQPLFEEQFSISYTIDGQEYKTILPVDQMNMYTGSGFNYNTNVTTMSLGPIFKLEGTAQISFLFGNYHYIQNDKTGNMARLKNLLRPGNKNYKCIFMLCDTALTEAVQVTFTEDPQGFPYWSTTKRTSIPGGVSAVVNQPGSFFTVTEIKESTTNGLGKNAVIVKGTFECILYDAATNDSKALKDGQFTFIVPTLN
jgi:hypothetical protein